MQTGNELLAPLESCTPSESPKTLPSVRAVREKEKDENTLLNAVAEEGRGAVIKCRNLQNIKEFLFSSERERDAGR